MKTGTNNTPGPPDGSAQNISRQRRERRKALAAQGDGALTSKPANGPIKDIPTPNKTRRKSKIAAAILLLGRKQGATLAEMIEATGWLPHTTRAALTGLKKKGHVIAKDKRNDVTCYRIAKSAQ